MGDTSYSPQIFAQKFSVVEGPNASGTGSPEGVVSGFPGYTFFDTQGGNLYIKDSGHGTTSGWVLFSGGSGGEGGSGLSGSGSPESVVTATPGTTYWDVTIGTLWVKATGIGSTGWLELIATAT